MGFHVGGLINLFIGKKRNDFFEMALHHLLTLYLFGGSYMFNVWECAAVIAFLHDIADIPGNLTKTLTNTNYGNVTAVAFIVTMVIWFYTRCFIFGTIIYQIIEMDVLLGHAMVKPFFCYLLSCLYLLHWYWFHIFCKLLYKYAFTGETEDT